MNSIPSVDALLDKLLGQYQVLAYFIIMSNIIHVHIHQQLLSHNLWVPPHHCKVPNSLKKSEALPLHLSLLGQNTSTIFLNSMPHQREPTYNTVPSQKNKNFETKRSTTENSEGDKDKPWHTPFLLQNQTILVWNDIYKEIKGIENNVQYSSCSMFVQPGEPTFGVQPCIYGYTFELNNMEWTIATEWLLVCNRLWLLTWLKKFYIGGLIFGGILLGHLADSIGRKVILITCLASFGIIGLGLYFVKHFIVFFCLRCLQGVLSQGLYVTSWTLLVELPPPKWRCRSLMIAGVAGPLGTILASIASLRLGHWRAIQLAVSLPVIASIFYSCLIPESLRLLLTKGKVARAHKGASRVSQLNALSLPPAMMANLKTLSDHLNRNKFISNSLIKKIKPLNLFRTPRLRKNIMIIWFVWLTISITENILRGGNILTKKKKPLFWFLKSPFMESLIEGAVDVGGVVVVVMLSSLMYRRSLIMILMLCIAVITLVFVVILKILDGSTPVIWIILKFCGILIISGTRSILQVISSEVVPTNTRATVFGVSFSLFVVGQIMATYIIDLGDVTYDLLPWVICSILCLFGTLFLFLLPETSGVNLPDIEEEAEMVGLQCKGDIIKSDHDPNYGRSPQLLDLDQLPLSYTITGAKESSHVINLESVIINKQSSRFRKKGHPKNFDSIPVNRENKHPNENELSESSLSTSSCSLYSSTSFTPVPLNNCKSCIRKSSKRRVYKVSPTSTSSVDLTSTENFSEENENECSITEVEEIENNSKIPADKYAKILPKRLKQTDQFNDIGEEHEGVIKRNNNNTICKTSQKPEKNFLRLKQQIESLSKYNMTIREDKYGENAPKIISAYPKPNKFEIAKTESTEDRREIEICALQPLHTKRTKSPTDVNRGKYNNFEKSTNSTNSNLFPISKNLKLQNLATKSVQRCPSNSKYKTFDKKSLERNKILMETPFRSNLSRQLSTIERTRSSIRLKLDRRPKAQSFLIPRKPRMGKLVSMHIERFERDLSIQPRNNFHQNIPIYSSQVRKTNIRTTPNSSFNIKTKIPAPITAANKTIPTFSNNPKLNFRFNGKRAYLENGKREKVSQNPLSCQDDFNKPSLEGEFVIPRSDIELTDDDEAYL